MNDSHQKNIADPHCSFFWKVASMTALPALILTCALACGCTRSLPGAILAYTAWPDHNVILVVQGGNIIWATLEFEANRRDKPILEIAETLSSPCEDEHVLDLVAYQGGGLLRCNDGMAYHVMWDKAPSPILDPCSEDSRPIWCADARSSMKQRPAEYGDFAWIDRGKETGHNRVFFDYHGANGSMRCVISGKAPFMFASGGFSVGSSEWTTDIRVAAVVESARTVGLVVVYDVGHQYVIVKGLSSDNPGIRASCRELLDP